MTYEIYTQKELMDKVKPRHTGGYRLDLQVNNCLLYTSPSPRDRG